MAGTLSGAVAAEGEKAWRTWSFFSVVCVYTESEVYEEWTCTLYEVLFEGLGSEMFHACGEGLIEGAREE